MEQIKSEEFYSLLQAQKFTGIKSRQYLSKYIDDGLLTAITVNSGVKKRYAIKGEWLISFIERYKNGLVQGEKYTISELKTILQGAVDYCKKNNISTLDEMIKSINKL